MADPFVNSLKEMVAKEKYDEFVQYFRKIVRALLDK